MVFETLVNQSVSLEFGKGLRGKGVVKERDLLTVMTGGEVVDKVVGV